MILTKSQYVAGVQCLKRLYLIVNEPELAAEQDATAEIMLAQGREVGLLARQLFPRGVTVNSRNPEEAIRATRELIANPEVPVIFEGAFEHKDVFVRVDILQRRKDKRWRLIEVKSTADLKDHQLDDVAIQTRVVSRSGVDLAAYYLAHVNRDYVFQGGSIDARRFFRMRNLTRRVEKAQSDLGVQLRSEIRALAMPQAPDLLAGKHCTNPVTCEFFDRCNLPRPDDHVSYLPRINVKAVEKLDTFRWESELSTWLHAIALNVTREGSSGTTRPRPRISLSISASFMRA